MTNNPVTTDSTASEEDVSVVPPPLPAKSRESSDYSNLPNADDSYGTIKQSPGKYKNKPLPALPTGATPTITNITAINASYDYVEARNFVHRGTVRPPTPPPKPSRNSKYVSM